MSRLTSDYHAPASRAKGELGLARREKPIAPPGLLVAALVALGIGALAFQVLAPDVKRYIKMRNM